MAKTATDRPARTSAVRPKDRPTSRNGARPKRPSTDRSQRRAPMSATAKKRLLIGVAAVCVLAIGGWLVLWSSIFGVRNVEVRGATTVSVEQVQQAAGLSADDALASVDLDAVAANVEKLPSVQSAKVERSWPSSVIVTITERTPVATVTREGVAWLVDGDGYVYAPAGSIGERAAALLPLDIADPGPDDLATRQAVEVIAGLTDEVRALTAKVTAPSPAQVTLVLQDGRQVIWGDASKMNDKLTLFPAILDHDGNVFDISSPSAIVIK